MATQAGPWWQAGVVYQIYPRSFLDADGDGVGDLDGVRSRLDHLVWLGVDALWLSPIFPSPMADYGYDVADYCDVDPVFGGLDAFDRLLAEAHERGLRVLLDWVPCHTSDRHPWFQEARSSPGSPKRDWYVWADQPNNWKAAFGGDAWSWDERAGQWYLHSFLPQQPDLNWRNPEVAEAMKGTLRFWLDRGVDGFRVDVVHNLVKPEGLPDKEDQFATVPHHLSNDTPETHDVLRDLRRLLDSYPGDRLMVGEMYLLSTERCAAFYGRDDELHLSFNFVPFWNPWRADRWRDAVAEVERCLGAAGAWPTWVLSNHDAPRHRTRFGGGEARARAAAVMLLTLRGTPFVYQGEELGLENATVPEGRQHDPAGRDGCRAPVPWDASPTHGWATPDPWLPWPPEADRRNREALAADEGSILHLYRRLLAVRRASPALYAGDWAALPAPDHVLAYWREAGGDRRAVLVNFSGDQVAAPVEGAWAVEVASDGPAGEGSRYRGRLAPDQAVILRPA